jgi:hypothetical protein
MPMPDQQFSFHIDEYKALRNEMENKLKDIRGLNRWGLLGLAGVYSFVFSQCEKPSLLFWVPVGLAAAIVAHIFVEHMMVRKIAFYVRDYIEKELAASSSDGTRAGWERHLRPTGQQLPRWDKLSLLSWEPTFLWIGIMFVAVAIAICQPSVGSRACLKNTSKSVMTPETFQRVGQRNITPQDFF